MSEDACRRHTRMGHCYYSEMEELTRRSLLRAIRESEVNKSVAETGEKEQLREDDRSAQKWHGQDTDKLTAHTPVGSS